MSEKYNEKNLRCQPNSGGRSRLPLSHEEPIHAHKKECATRVSKEIIEIGEPSRNEALVKFIGKPVRRGNQKRPNERLVPEQRHPFLVVECPPA